jgi:hypothetical protein
MTGQSDVVNCGPGRDRVEFDAGLGSMKRYEVKEEFVLALVRG